MSDGCGLPANVRHLAGPSSPTRQILLWAWAVGTSNSGSGAAELPWWPEAPHRLVLWEACSPPGQSSSCFSRYADKLSRQAMQTRRQHSGVILFSDGAEAGGQLGAGFPVPTDSAGPLIQPSSPRCGFSSRIGEASVPPSWMFWSFNQLMMVNTQDSGGTRSLYWPVTITAAITSSGRHAGHLARSPPSHSWQEQVFLSLLFLFSLLPRRRQFVKASRQDQDYSS